MKKILILSAFMCIAEYGNSQQFYQAGNYNKQRQKSYVILSGKLKEKFRASGFYWYVIIDNKKEYNVNIVDTIFYKKYKSNDQVVLNNCFKIESMRLKNKS